MTGFWVGAVGLALLAWLMLALPGAAPTRSPMRAGARERSNLDVLKDQLAAIDAEFAAGRVDAAERAAARADIERRALDETTRVPDAGARAATPAQPPPRRALAALALAIPALAFGLYGFLGNLDGLAPRIPTPAVAAAAPAEVPAQAVEAMLDDMARRMEAQAEGTTDATGWAMLARSYAALQRFDAAGRAYGRAIALAPDDAQLRADRADVLSKQQSGGAAPGARITGRLSIAPELAARVQADDTVFVFARAQGGPAMPVAVARFKASELPLVYTLDDTAAMAGGPRLSDVPGVVVGARVSRSGDALPQRGDLRGESTPVRPGQNGVDIVIGTVQP